MAVRTATAWNDKDTAAISHQRATALMLKIPHAAHSYINDTVLTIVDRKVARLSYFPQQHAVFNMFMTDRVFVS